MSFEARGLAFLWDEGGVPEPVFHALSFKINKGEKVVLLGTNGSGKSTLLKLLNGLIFPTSGKLLWQGEQMDAAYFKNAQTSRAFRKDCVLLFQHPEAMLFQPTVYDELAYGPRQLGCANIDARVRFFASALGVTPLLEKPPFLLSGGEKQKVALAALLTLEPTCFLLDEPSANLDLASIAWMIDFFKESSATLIISTHQLSLARELGERALILNPQGILMFDGPLEEAFSSHVLLKKAGLIHGEHHHHNTDILRSPPFF